MDYYTRTVFEIQSGDVGSQSALCGGGRYDGLVKELGGQDTPGFGFALGYERTLLALQERGLTFEPAKSVDYFVACVSDECRDKCFEIAQTIRDLGFCVELDYQNRSLKSQFKLADKFYAKKTIIVGPDELKEDRIVVRDMQTHEQQDVPLDELVSYVSLSKK